MNISHKAQISSRNSFSLSSFSLQKVSPKLVPIKIKLYNSPQKNNYQIDHLNVLNMKKEKNANRFSIKSETKYNDSRRRKSRGLSMTLSQSYISIASQCWHYLSLSDKKIPLKKHKQDQQLQFTQKKLNDFSYRNPSDIFKVKNSQNFKININKTPVLNQNSTKFLKNQKTTELKSILNRCKGIIISQNKVTTQRTNPHRNIDMNLKTAKAKTRLFKNNEKSQHNQEKNESQQKTIQKCNNFNTYSRQKQKYIQNKCSQKNQLTASPLSMPIKRLYHPLIIQNSPFQVKGNSNKKDLYSPHNQLLVNQQKLIKNLKQQLKVSSPNQKKMPYFDFYHSRQQQSSSQPQPLNHNNLNYQYEKFKKVQNLPDNYKKFDDKQKFSNFQNIFTTNYHQKKQQTHTVLSLDSPNIKKIKNRIMRLEDISTVQSKQQTQTSPQSQDTSPYSVLVFDKKKSQFMQNCEISPIKKISFENSIQKNYKNFNKIILNDNHIANTHNDMSNSISDLRFQTQTKTKAQQEDSFFQKYQLYQQQCQTFQKIIRQNFEHIKPVKRRLQLQSFQVQVQSQRQMNNNISVKNKKELQSVKDVKDQQYCQENYFVQKILESLQKNCKNGLKNIKFQLVKICSDKLSLIKQQNSQWIFGAGLLKTKSITNTQNQQSFLVQLKNPNCLQIYYKTSNFYLTEPFEYSLDQLYSLNLLPKNQLQIISKILKDLTIELHKLDSSFQFDLQKINQKIVYIHGVLKFIPLVIKEHQRKTKKQK